MQAKSTSELERDLSGCADLHGYLKQNAPALHAPELPELLHQAIETHGLSRAELLHAGYAQLYVRDPRDSILFYALESGMSLVACNQQLDAHGSAVLG